MTKTVIHGLDELESGLEQQLQQLQGREVKRALGKAVYAGAALLRDEARKRAPVETGFLRKAITAGRGRPRGDTLAIAGVRVKTGSAFYWRFLEFGTVHQVAQPFLRPAFDANEQRIGQVVTDRLQDAIHEELAKR